MLISKHLDAPPNTETAKKGSEGDAHECNLTCGVDEYTYTLFLKIN
jgi:hypothetical protein